MAKKFIETGKKPIQLKASELNSFKDIPLSAKEIREIQIIQEQAYWRRKSLKEEFCRANKRIMSELNTYFKENKKSPLSHQGKRKSSKRVITLPTPKESVVYIPGENTARISPAGEIRLKYKTFRIEGGEIIFSF